MGFIDHLKNNKPEDLVLEFAFGWHLIEGDLAKSIVTGASPTHIVKLQQMLGDGLGKGWKGPKGVWFRGINRTADKYKFYPGIMSPDPVIKTFTADNTTDTLTSTAHGYTNGTMVIFPPKALPAPLVAGNIYYVIAAAANTFQVSLTSGGAAVDLTTNGTGTLEVYANSAVQGIDPVFFQDTPHSNSAWIRLECPSGAETGIPDFDTKENPPVGHYGIYECQLGDIYNSAGAVTSSDVLITNVADVLAFGCMEIRKYDLARINFAKLDTLRAFCDVTETPDYTTLPTGVGLTARYYEGAAFGTLKSKRVDPVIQYDLSAGAPALDITPTSFSALFEGKIRFKYSETYTFYLTHNDGGRLYVDNLATAIIDQWATTATDSATFAATADAFKDIKLEWKNEASTSQFMLEWQSASQPRQVVPQDRLYPKAEALKRFECHQAFTARTNFDAFLRSILVNCNGTYQDVDGKLEFFSIDQISSSFAFNETNIVKNTFVFHPRYTQQELMNLPNRFVAEGRDLDSRYLEKFDPPLFYDVPELQEIAGRIIEEIVYIGNTNRWQGLKNLAHHAKLKTAQMICEFDGMPVTLPVLPGDKVTVSHTNSGWVTKLFLVLEATDKSIDSNPDERIFKLLDW